MKKSASKPIKETVDSKAKNFLTDSEIKKFLEAARKGRHSVHDYCLALTAYRHALRVSELIDIRPKDLDLESSRIFVRRLKGSLLTHQPVKDDESRAIKAWLRERENYAYSGSD